MNDLEIILNLWYVSDEAGFVYSLRARAYLKEGTDEEKLKYLKEHSLTDYLIARSFKIPDNITTHFSDGLKLPVIPISSLNSMPGNNLLHIFEGAIKELEMDLPAQTKHDIPKEPLVVITPLIGDDNGNIKPNFIISDNI